MKDLHGKGKQVKSRTKAFDKKELLELVKNLFGKEELVKTNGPEWKVFSVLVGSTLSLRLAAYLLSFRKKENGNFKEMTFAILSKLILTNAMLDGDMRGKFNDWFVDFYLTNSYYRLSMLTTHSILNIDEIKKISDPVVDNGILSSETFHTLLENDQNDCLTQLFTYTHSLYLKHPFNKPDNSSDSKNKQNLGCLDMRHEWVIKSRCKNQKLLLELYNKKDCTIKSKKWSAFHALVGSTFSLWRAAPHCDNQRDPKTFVKNTFRVLDILKEDRLVRFTEETENEEWMVGYYLRSSYFRLENVASEKDKKNVEILQYEKFSELLKNKPQDCWDALHKYSKKLFEATFS